MSAHLNGLSFGHYGYGKVLSQAGLFVLRGDASDFHYIPTDYLWSVFDGRPNLDHVLFVLHELVHGLAHERMDFRTGKLRQTWAVEMLKALGATDEGITRLKLLLTPYVALSAVWLVASDRS